MKVIKATICAFVHHKGWCTGFHKKQIDDAPWRSECPFQDAAMLALFPPKIIGNIRDLPMEDLDALVTPGVVIKGEME